MRGLTTNQSSRARGRDTHSHSASSKQLALAIADVNWFSTEHLFRALQAPHVHSLLLHCQDFQNAWNAYRSRDADTPARLTNLADRQSVHRAILPPGWMKRYPRQGMKPLQWAINRWHRTHAPRAPLALVMTYPYYLHLADLLQPDKTVYFNFDDYALYWPSKADEVRALELEAVKRSSLTVCTSRLRRDDLAQLVPEAAHKIHHLPHGAPELAFTPAPSNTPAPPPPDIAHLPRPYLGYFGSLEDRVDWPLLHQLATRFPKASLVLVGRGPDPLDPSTPAQVRDCLTLPNVHALGWRTQDQMRTYNAAFDVCLIPYQPDHPFNRACCPTKILDYLATGRPVVSTNLPECRLHHDIIKVAPTHHQFLEAVAAHLDFPDSNDSQAPTRQAYAQERSCHEVATRFLKLLNQS